MEQMELSTEDRRASQVQEKYSELLAEEDHTARKRKRLPWYTHAAFAALGIGPGWLLCDAVYLQIPWLQTTQPEGLALASWMMSAFNAANVIIFPLLIAHQLWRGSPHVLDEAVMVGMIIATVGGLVLASLLWDQATERHSVAILAFSFLGGAIGSLRLSVMMPWLLRYDEELISSVVLGSALADGASAIVALVQQPGGRRLFSPAVFFRISATLALPSLVAYALIKRFELGLLAQFASAHPTHKSLVSAIDATGPTRVVGEPDATLSPSTEIGAAGRKLAVSTRGANLPSPSGGEPPAVDVSARRRLPEWFWRAARLWLMFAVCQCVVWGVTPGLLPFAAENAVRGSGRSIRDEDVLSLSIDLSYLGLVAGSYLSIVLPSYWLAPQVLLLLSLSAICMAMAFQTSAPPLPALSGSVLLIVSSVLMRFVDGYTTAMIFRTVSADDRYGAAQNTVQRAISLAERVSTTIGAAISFWLARRLMVEDAASLAST